MNKKYRKQALAAILAAALTAQPIFSTLPSMVFADAYSYMHENFAEGLEKWNDADNAEMITDESGTYLRYKGETDEALPAYRNVDTPIESSSSVYMVDFDIRFEDDNSGVVELYSSQYLGPTVIFDGTNIKTKTGNPSTYVTMYKNAQAGKWYHVKLIAKGKSSMDGYTADIEDGVY